MIIRAVIANSEQNFQETVDSLTSSHPHLRFEYRWVREYQDLIYLIAEYKITEDRIYYARDYQTAPIFQHPKMKGLVSGNQRIMQVKRQRELLGWWSSLTDDEREELRLRLETKRREKKKQKRMNDLVQYAASRFTGQ